MDLPFRISPSIFSSWLTCLSFACCASFADDSATAGTLSLSERRAQVANEIHFLIERAEGKTIQERAQIFTSWRDANRERLQILAAEVNAANEQRRTPTRPLISQVEIPEGADAQVERFFVEKAKLHNDEVRNVDAPFPHTNEAWQERRAAWESANRARIEQQQQLGRIVAQESEPAMLRIPATPNIPRHALPELRSYLMLRYELSRDETIEENRIRTLAPTEREAARRVWRETNADRFNAVEAAAIAAFSRQLTQP